MLNMALMQELLIVSCNDRRSVHFTTKSSLVTGHKLAENFVLCTIYV